VCRVFIFKAPGIRPLTGLTGIWPLTGLTGVRQHGGLPGPPPVVPHPESLAAQAAYTEALLPGSGSGPNCFQALGSPRACHRVPYCVTLKRETPVAPRRVQGGLSGPPRVRAEKSNRPHIRHRPLGQRSRGLVRPDRLPLGKEARGGWVAVTGHPPNGAPGPEKFRHLRQTKQAAWGAACKE